MTATFVLKVFGDLRGDRRKTINIPSLAEFTFGQLCLEVRRLAPHADLGVLQWEDAEQECFMLQDDDDLKEALNNLRRMSDGQVALRIRVICSSVGPDVNTQMNLSVENQQVEVSSRSALLVSGLSNEVQCDEDRSRSDFAVPGSSSEVQSVENRRVFVKVEPRHGSDLDGAFTASATEAQASNEPVHSSQHVVMEDASVSPEIITLANASSISNLDYVTSIPAYPAVIPSPNNSLGQTQTEAVESVASANVFKTSLDAETLIGFSLETDSVLTEATPYAVDCVEAMVPLKIDEIPLEAVIAKSPAAFEGNAGDHYLRYVGMIKRLSRSPPATALLPASNNNLTSMCARTINFRALKTEQAGPSYCRSHPQGAATKTGRLGLRSRTKTSRRLLGIKQGVGPKPKIRKPARSSETCGLRVKLGRVKSEAQQGNSNCDLQPRKSRNTNPCFAENSSVRASAVYKNVKSLRNQARKCIGSFCVMVHVARERGTLKNGFFTNAEHLVDRFSLLFGDEVPELISETNRNYLTAAKASSKHNSNLSRRQLKGQSTTMKSRTKKSSTNTKASEASCARRFERRFKALLKTLQHRLEVLAGKGALECVAAVETPEALRGESFSEFVWLEIDKTVNKPKASRHQTSSNRKFTPPSAQPEEAQRFKCSHCLSSHKSKPRLTQHLQDRHHNYLSCPGFVVSAKLEENPFVG